MIDWNQSFSYSFPTNIRFGKGVIQELPDFLIEQDVSKPLIVTDSTVASLPFFGKILRRLDLKGLEPEVYDKMHKNPIKSDVLQGKDFYTKTNRDSIVAIGGGVAMDVARAIALSINHHRDLFDYDDLLGGDQYITEHVPILVTVPTTAGTGSEVGRSAIISEDDSKKKRILFHPKLMAKIVFADPELTMDLPPYITAATGMDALTHHMEAFLAKGFHPMCEGIALEGIRLISGSLVNATHRPDLASRSKMLIASLMGAVAFQKGLGVVHSLAHPLSSLLDTHHGLANAINLPHGMAFNYEGNESKFDHMAFAWGLGSQAGRRFLESLSEINRELKLPENLSEIGVTQDHIPTLSQLAAADFAHPNNPKPVTKTDFENLYRKAL